MHWGFALVGTAAAETRNPKRNLPRAVTALPIRIVLVYVGSHVVLVSVVP